MILVLRKIAEKLIKFFYRVKIYGKENVPDGGVMIVCNHFSILDPVFLLSVYSKKDVCFLSKKEATDKGAFGKALIKAGAIPVDREKPSMESIITCVKTLKNGQKLVLFPEGTRNKTGTNEIQPIKAGAAIFAIKAKTPILPVAIL
ncbi:MAG: 1-acyl-sn-glycerol-3-phosphate acyltransferase, partial [Clostridia bacterium]|nr:1-acyl-sn-glycerol-3-phosphate acyltransferase [Clostridia bacterium]